MIIDRETVARKIGAYPAILTTAEDVAFVGARVPQAAQAPPDFH
ncbi:MAG: hypothetical protein NTW86_31785 [Candidatus Sumerlaeota bacterium]|nr:hypothetical protein [Candidatus Sumerlaeota bacterium]